MSTDPTTADAAPRVARQEQQEASREVAEVAPDVLRIELPISLPGLGHVACYVLVDGEGVAVVDPGLPGGDSLQWLERRLGEAGIAFERIHTVIATHSHFDHFGAVGHVAERAGAQVVTHAAFSTFAGEIECTDPTHDHGDPHQPERHRRQDGLTPWGTKGPWPTEAEIDEIHRRLGAGGEFVRPHPTKRLRHGQTIHLARREWTALHTPGHTHDHLCLYDPTERVLLTGDHVLPTITPHIAGSLLGDPLEEFYGSLRAVGELDVALALPAHGYPFSDLSSRTESIHEHHLERLGTLVDAVRALGWASVVAASQELFRERSWGYMAESETFAHLEHLRLTGRMERRSTADGGLEYRVIDG